MTRPVFATTHWTQVLAAGNSHTALANLCQAYWYPLYAYIRQRGHQPSDAQDLTQEFFTRLIERNSFADITQSGGKFRSYLLRSLDRFLVDEWRKATAQKRGSGKIISLDADEAETRYRREPSHNVTPEKLFEQTYALALLEQVYKQLQQEYADRPALFTALKPCLLGSREILPYAELAAQLNQTEANIKTQVHRLRQRFGALLRQTVSQTLPPDANLNEELQHLLRSLN